MEKPAFGGGTEVTEHFYNAAGQLVRTLAPGQADTLAEYDDLGRPWRSGFDLDGNGALLPASADRICVDMGRWSVRRLFSPTGDAKGTLVQPVLARERWGSGGRSGWRSLPSAAAPR